MIKSKKYHAWKGDGIYMQKALPPVIRLFISSTFADMNRERQYFNTVIAPKLRKMCTERGVSFFSVDLRWGITEEDQMQGNVIPICLREIDKCRPFFIGILGNRYGSIAEDITPEAKDSFPWLNEQMGKSVTELEMYYAVLQNERRNETPNCAFFFRSDRLSEQVYPETESSSKLEKLHRLKTSIRENENLPSYDYDSLEQFEQQILSTTAHWLDTLFPSVESVRDTRKKWYNSELLRDHVHLESMQTFLDSYFRNSNHTLMVYGDGPRGKTTALTAWTPQDSEKILINCGADEEYQYWPAIAHEIINQLRKLDENVGFPEFHAYASLFFRMMESIRQKDQETEAANHTMYYVTDEDLESFRKGFAAWLKTVTPRMPVYIVINDVDLLTDNGAEFMTWLPNETGENVHLICSANDDSILENVQTLGWNAKEMPLLSKQSAMRFLDNYMGIFGKKLSAAQLEKLEKTPLLFYPGHLKRIVQFFNNYGNFENLDELTAAVGQLETEEDLDSFILDHLIGTLSSQEAAAARNAFFILCETSLGLQENDLYNMVQELAHIDAIGWSAIRVILEQFQLITSDTWKIRNDTLCEIVRRFPVDKTIIHCLLGRFFKDQMDEAISRTSEGIKRNTDFAKAALWHYAAAEDWETLVNLLQDPLILYYLSKMEWPVVRSMWMNLLLFSDLDVSEKLMETFSLCDREYGHIEGIQQRIISLMVDLELCDIASEASSRSGLPKVSSLRFVSKDLFTNENGQIYNNFCTLKEQRRFLLLLESVNAFLNDHASELSPYEKCCFLALKQDAEIQSGNMRSAFDTIYQYYASAIASMNEYEILRAVLARGNLLYYAGRNREIEKTLRYIRKLALNLGNIREYLASLNVEGMCRYRQERYRESVACFEMCMRTWKRLNNDLEYITCWMNKTNSIVLSGDLSEAAQELESLVQYIKTCPKHEELAFQEAKVLCNLANVYDDQGRDAEAEQAFLQSIAVSKGKSEGTPNAYYGLIAHYEKRNLYTKAIGIYQELIEYLYQRNLYSETAEALKKCIMNMQVCNFSEQAKSLLQKWEAIFDRIPGGRRMLGQEAEETSDHQLEDQLREQIAVARSEKNHKDRGNLLFRLAVLANGSHDPNACDLYIQAMEAFTAAEDRKRAAECACAAIGLLIDAGPSDPRFDSICAALSSEDRALVELWIRLRDAAAADSAYAEGLRQLMERSTPDHPIAYRCLISEAERMLEKAPADLLVRILEWMKAGQQYPDFEQAIGKAARADFMSHIDYLRRNESGARADQMLEVFEKKIALLEAMGEQDAGAIAGNIALIYRRRHDREQTIRNHMRAIRIFREHNAPRDMLIEQMNLATAYNAFDMPENSLQLLRDMMQDPALTKFPDIQAGVAGNLAAYLIQSGNPAAKEEILACFVIEESYFEKAGDVRELVISLLNQLYYDQNCSTMTPDERKNKLLRAEQIAEKHKLREFEPRLRSLRSRIMKEPEQESKFTSLLNRLKKSKLLQDNAADLRDLLKKLMGKDSEYEVAETVEETEHLLHVLLYLKKKNPFVTVNVHLWIDCEDGFTLKYLFAMKPNMMSENAAPLIHRYMDWWNQQHDYELILDRHEDGDVILAVEQHSSHNWDDLVGEYRRMEKFWKADVVCVTLAALGTADLKNMQEMKTAIMKEN